MRRLLAIAFAALWLGFAQSSAALAFTREPVSAKNGMVVSSQAEATRVGVDILRAGGNAIDAAVAVGYALAVTNPCCGNIGGGGFATIHLADGRDIFFNFREKAPSAATEAMYLDDKGEIIKDLSLKGYLAVGVPGSVLGLDTMLAKYGTMPRDKIMAPAIALAEDGFVLSEGDADIMARYAADFVQQANVAAIFLKDDKPLKAGDRLIQKHLANTLKLIAKDGPDAFYKGSIMNALVAASAANGGILSKQDFEAYRVSEAEPVRCTYRGFAIISAAPPSSGGTTICLILNIIEAYPISEYGYQSAQSVHLMVEAMRHAYVDRNFLLGDPDFVNNPVEHLVSKSYADKIRASIDAGKAGNSRDVQQGVPPHEGLQTTHYSIVDAKGNAVAVTYTINALFGAGVIAGDTGFFLNDEMDDFTTKPGAPNLFGLVQGKKNAIAPGKRPLSSMSPTIVMKDGKVAMVTGSPGGSRIISIVVQTIMNVADHGMTVQEAVNAPRIHHQWLPDQITAEPFALSPDTRKILEGMGYKIVEQPPWGAAEAIMISPDAGLLLGGHDDRRPAGAAGGF